MIRKTIIPACVVLNLATVVLWFASQLAIGESHGHMADGVSVRLSQGHVEFNIGSTVTTRAGSGAIAPVSWSIGTDRLGFGRSVGESTICEQPWRIGERDFAISWNLAVPLWLPFLLTAACPTFAFIRGPFRHWCRLRKGLCLACGYNLNGNVSGVCPECGRAK